MTKPSLTNLIAICIHRLPRVSISQQQQLSKFRKSLMSCTTRLWRRKSRSSRLPRLMLRYRTLLLHPRFSVLKSPPRLNRPMSSSQHTMRKMEVILMRLLRGIVWPWLRKEQPWREASEGRTTSSWRTSPSVDGPPLSLTITPRRQLQSNLRSNVPRKSTKTSKDRASIWRVNSYIKFRLRKGSSRKELISVKCLKTSSIPTWATCGEPKKARVAKVSCFQIASYLHRRNSTNSLWIFLK